MASLLNATCPAINAASRQSSDAFWDGIWDDHKIGWLIAGVAASIATLLSLVTVFFHACNYVKPKEQRQIIRIVLMPLVYAIVAFFSYRFFREYSYYAISVVIYESLVVAAFLYLLLQYIGQNDDEQKQLLLAKEKQKLIFPFCCWRYRPSKPYFLHALRFSVLQYSFLRPAISIAAIICEAYGVLCPTMYSIHYAGVYLDSVDFVSISVALFGLVVFYSLVKEQLKGKRPLLKFLSIKLIVFFTFYQVFLFGVLQDHNVIKATQFWTAENIADGLNSLVTTLEMVLFAALMMYAFNWHEYRVIRGNAPTTNPIWGILDALNFYDFARDLCVGIAYSYASCMGRHKQQPDGASGGFGFDINAAFNQSKTSAAPSMADLTPLHSLPSASESAPPFMQPVRPSRLPIDSLPRSIDDRTPRPDGCQQPRYGSQIYDSPGENTINLQ